MTRKTVSARVGEFPTYGVGPHELLLLGDDRTIAIANGGIETHPDFGRAKLNLPTMKPSYVLVDRMTGDLIEKHELPPELHQLSIRHMDTDETGAVWFGCQHEGPATERPALVGRAVRGKELQLIDMPRGRALRLPQLYRLGRREPRRGHGRRHLAAGQLVRRDRGGERQGRRGGAADRGLRRCADHSGFMVTTGTGMIVEPDGKSSEDAELRLGQSRAQRFERQ